MKSDKELATELTIAFIQSWNAKNSTNALQITDAVDVLMSFENALSKMGSKES